MSFLLLKSLEALLREGFSGFVFRQNEDEPGTYIEPNFFIGALPPRRKAGDPEYQDDGYFPFIVNRFSKGSDMVGKSVVGVETICGIHTAESVEGGENDITNMVFVAKRTILQKRTFDAFTLEDPLEWSVGDPNESHTQAYPFYVGKIITQWIVPSIEQTLGVDDRLDVYGDGY